MPECSEITPSFEDFEIPLLTKISGLYMNCAVKWCWFRPTTCLPTLELHSAYTGSVFKTLGCSSASAESGSSTIITVSSGRYKLVLRIRLSTPAVQHLALNQSAFVVRIFSRVRCCLVPRRSGQFWAEPRRPLLRRHVLPISHQRHTTFSHHPGEPTRHVQQPVQRQLPRDPPVRTTYIMQLHYPAQLANSIAS